MRLIREIYKRKYEMQSNGAHRMPLNNEEKSVAAAMGVSSLRNRCFYKTGDSVTLPVYFLT
jgi:hypothetical protein